MAVQFTEAEAAIQNSDALYNRYAAVTVGSTRWTGNRITFKVTKTYRKNPNPAEITVYNLSQSARDMVSQRGVTLNLIAGYVGNAATLYTGQVVGFVHKRDGTEWVSTFTCRDGDAAWLKYTNRSYAKGVPRLTVAKALASDMGYTLGSDAAALIDAYGSTRSGIVTHGHSFAEMDNLLLPLGLTWSIQDGQLQVVEAGGKTNETAVLLTPQTGLVGVPERMEQYHKPGSKNKGVPSQVRVVSLLQAGIRPGRQLRVEAATETGNFTCLNVEHSGDTHGDDWISTAECQQLYGG